MDGGIGHVHAAMEVLSELGINLPVAGMARMKNIRLRSWSMMWSASNLEKNRNCIFLLLPYRKRFIAIP